MKKKKQKNQRLASMTVLYMKRGFKQPHSHASAFMRGYKTA